MSSREGLLFASMLVTPSTLSFEPDASEKRRFAVVGFVAAAVMAIGLVVTVTTPTEQPTRQARTAVGTPTH